MEYDELIKSIGELGTYQKRLLALIVVPLVGCSFAIPIAVFIHGFQDHRCKIPGLPNDTFTVQNEAHRTLINETIPLDADGSYKHCSVIMNGTEHECSEWVYDQSVFALTVDSQFNLVCSKKLYKSHVILAYLVGRLLATLTICPLADVIGRKLSLNIMITVQFITNIIMPFSPNVFVFAATRFADGLSGLGLYHCSFIIVMELVGPSKRLFFSVAPVFLYCISAMFLGFLAYFIRDWRWLQLTVAVPMVIPLIFWIPNVFPDSPRWLFARGRYQEGMEIIRRAARVNKKELPPSTFEFKDSKKKEDIIALIKELFHSPKLLKCWAIVVSNWFVIAFIYFGLSLNVGKLDGDLFTNFAISMVMETIGSSSALLLDLTGRKPLYLSAMFAAGISCLLSIFPILFAGPSLAWISVALSMVGKLGISSAFCIVYIYTGELFPTVVRSTVIATGSFCARIGSLLSPYLYMMADGKIGNALPLIIYGVTTIIVALLATTLAETRRRKLQERLGDAEPEEAVELHQQEPIQMKTE